MTTKESLYEIIETFDDEQTVMILEYAEMIVRLQSQSTLPAYDPMNDLIGMFHSETPTDIENFKDQYIADAISSHFENIE